MCEWERERGRKGYYAGNDRPLSSDANNAPGCWTPAGDTTPSITRLFSPSLLSNVYLRPMSPAAPFPNNGVWLTKVAKSAIAISPAVRLFTPESSRHAMQERCPENIYPAAGRHVFQVFWAGTSKMCNSTPFAQKQIRDLWSPFICIVVAIVSFGTWFFPLTVE